MRHLVAYDNEISLNESLTGCLLFHLSTDCRQKNREVPLVRAIQQTTSGLEAPCPETAATSPGTPLKINLYCSSKALRDCSTLCLMTSFSFSAFLSTSWNCSINLPAFI